MQQTLKHTEREREKERERDLLNFYHLKENQC